MARDRERPPTRADYRAFFEIATRWLDNDIYGHVNNVNYYGFFDTAIAHYLMQEGGLDPWNGTVIGYCVESGCRFRRAARFPDRITAGVKVTRLGRSSVRYEIGLFRNDEDEAAADGHFVHVFVERGSERPTAMPPALRAALDRLRDEPD
ncbi:MAG: acyl-CoA thioesterase [Geminicoccaceae bacterium]